MLNNGITFSEGQTRQVNNSLFELQSKGQTNECRKVQIGDLSSIDKSLKEKAERKLNHAKNVKQKQFSSAAKSLQNRVDYLIYHAEQPSTKDQALISGSQYNCDPMNDPIYEKKAFNGTLKQSANAMPIAPKLDFSSSAQSQKTYFAEPSLPSSPVAPQIQRKGSKDAETIFKRLSSYPSFIQQQTTPAQKKTVPDAQNARKSILVNLKQLNMNFGQRPRSVSDPLVRWSKFLGANKPSPLVSRRAKDSAKSEVGLKGHKEKSHDQRNRSTSFQRSSFPIKITSFTPGERISQEYIFGKKSETISDRIAYSGEKPKTAGVVFMLIFAGRSTIAQCIKLFRYNGKTKRKMMKVVFELLLKKAKLPVTTNASCFNSP